jgi:hypothetical protein
MGMPFGQCRYDPLAGQNLYGDYRVKRSSILLRMAKQV